MRRYGATALAVAAAVLAAVAGPAAGPVHDLAAGPRTLPAPGDTLREVVLAEIGDYYDDLSARDWPAYEAHFWPGATITTVWQPPGQTRPSILIQTIHEIVRRAAQGPGSKPVFEERMRNAEVRVEGKLAQVWARYDARFGDSNAVREWQGTDAFTLLEHDGRWRIAALVFAGD